jgi:hypothetical protein
VKSLKEIAIQDLSFYIEKEIRKAYREGEKQVRIKNFFKNDKIIGETLLKELDMLEYKYREDKDYFGSLISSDLIIDLTIK